MTSVLSVDGLAAASHMTAGHLWGVLDRPDAIEVVVGRRGIRRDSFVVHQSTDLEPGHVTIVDGIPTTTAARTAIDIGVPHGLGSVARFVDEARRRGLLDLEDTARLHHRLARRGRNGVGPARTIIAERLQWDQITDSQLEDRFLRLIQRTGLPKPVSQHRVHDEVGLIIARLDFAYPERLVAVELDSIAHHTDRDSFRTDRRRQNRLILSGWTVLRFTWWDVLAGEEWVLDSLSAALASPRN